MKSSVSVILPHYNAADTIGRSIDSVIAQTLCVEEIIIVDDCSVSAEELIDIVSGYKALINIRLIFLKKNQGAAYARNIAIKNATCKYIAFLDSDDIWHPEKIKTQYEFMEKNGAFLSGHGYLFDISSSSFIKEVSLSNRLVMKREFMWGNPFFTPTVMAKREDFILFDERYRRVDDYKCWYENMSNGHVYMLTEVLAAGFKAPVGESGLSGSLRLMHKGYLDVLKALRAEGNISGAFFIAATTCERLKYPLRLFFSKIRKYMK